MNFKKVEIGLKKAVPRRLDGMPFIRAYNSRAMSFFGKRWFFDCLWSFSRGYRFNFRGTWPVLYLACDPLTASAEIGPRTRADLLVPYLDDAQDPFLYVNVKVTAPVLDLTRPAVRKTVGIALSELLIPTEKWDDDMDKGIRAATHRLGKLVLDSGRFEGILYPSYPARKLLRMKDKFCLAVFMDPSHPHMAEPRNPDVKLEVVDSGNFLKSSGVVF